MRSVELARAMNTLGVGVDFWLDPSCDHWRSAVDELGGHVLTEAHDLSLVYEALWLDHYDVGAEEMRALGLPVSGILDAGDSDVNLDLSVSYAACPKADLFGFQYALIDEGYASLPRPNTENTVYTLCFGQRDSAEATLNVLKALEFCDDVLNLNVVCGAYNKDADEIGVLCVQSKHDCTILKAPPDLKGVLADTDVFFTSGGVSALEACAAGVVCAVIVTADNQMPQVQALHDAKAVLSCGHILDLSSNLIKDVVVQTGTANLRSRISSCSKRVIDGKGARRLADALLNWRLLLND